MAIFAIRRFLPKLFLITYFVLGGAIVAACDAQPTEIPSPPPQPSSTPTINFADLPPAVMVIPDDQTATPVPIVTATSPPAANTPSPNPTLNLLPATPDLSWEPCPEAPRSVLRVSDRASISYEPYLPTRVRTRPGKNVSSVLGLIIPGEVVEIIEGPACMDQAVWWKIKSLRKDLEGWVQEGDETSRWLVRTDADSAVRIPRPTAPPCPVADEALCSFVEGLQAPVALGNFVEILANTRTFDCPDSDSDSRCAQWGVLGTGLGGLDLTPLALIEPGWLTYAPPPRSITGLLIPPYEEVDTPLPAVPAMFIRTRDPLWDWLFFIEAVEGEWQISALMMISRESGAYPSLTDRLVAWSQ